MKTIAWTAVMVAAIFVAWKIGVDIYHIVHCSQLGGVSYCDPLDHSSNP